MKIVRRSKKIFSFFLACLFCMAFLSCGESRKLSENVFARFTDDLGREVVLENEPTRVAALLGSFAEVWTLAGGALCASAEDGWSDFGLALGDAVNIGGAHSPSTERLLAADPELVLASASTASHVAMGEILEEMGIAVAYFDVDHVSDYLRMLRICTDLTGREDLYEKNGLEIQERIQSIKKQYAELGPSDGERTVLLLRTSSATVKAKGSQGTILGEMLADMGCINLADRDGSLLDRLSVETAIKAEPTHIFIVTMGNDTEGAYASLRQMMADNPAWGSLRAVRENRVHVMDKELFNLKPNARWAEAYEVLYEALTKP